MNARKGEIYTKTCIVFGNCQIWSIAKYLKSSKTFNAIYRVLDIPAVHLANIEAGVGEENLRKCDLFIYQKVSGDRFGPYLKTDYILNQLPTTCTKISFPSLYFTGYTPQFLYAGSPFYYDDKNAIALFNEGKSKEQIISMLSDDNFYSYTDLKTNLDSTLSELRRREQELDISVVDYIEQNYREKYLFYTINHPTYLLSKYTAMEILKKLNIPENEIAAIVIEEKEFQSFIHPIYPSVIRHLDLRFMKPTYTINNYPLTFQEYLSKYIDYLIELTNLNGN